MMTPRQGFLLMTTISSQPEYRSLSRVAESDASRQVGDILASAFSNDSLMAHALPNIAIRSKVLPPFYEKIARVAMMLGGAELWSGSAVALWLESRMEAPLLLYLRLGFLRMLWTMGPLALIRIMRHEHYCAARVRRLGPMRYGYLWVLGVAPVLQKSGWGRASLDRTTEILRQRGHTVCLLKTETEGNVEFYTKSGFSCVDTCIVPSSGIRYWLMQKDLAKEQTGAYTHRDSTTNLLRS